MLILSRYTLYFMQRYSRYIENALRNVEEYLKNIWQIARLKCRCTEMLILSSYIFTFKKNNGFALAISFIGMKKMLIYVAQVDN